MQEQEPVVAFLLFPEYKPAMIACGKHGSGDRSDVSLLVEWGLVGPFGQAQDRLRRMRQGDNGGGRLIHE